MDDDVHRRFPPPTAADRVDDVDAEGTVPEGRPRSRRSRLAPPAADQRVELSRPRQRYLAWVVLVTLLGMAVAVYFLF
ncbi:hypothetical protein [Georgenia sp. SUBG003]|uniref:hypothetical protein n=1 Tax=Georgenia sp. SUBG003 TaxID=1497974 RepID=UPI0004D9DDBE|nr:hypothetical protein DA06_18135 [Georgenia sp. SUBG003]